MKLRDIYRIYDGYQIVVYGRPLDQPTIPFTFLPKDKDLKECKVMDYRVEKKERELPVFHITKNGVEKYRTEHTLGNVYVYVK